MTQKRIVTLICIFVLVFNLCGCTKTGGNTLMQYAAPESSALMLYTYDGEEGNHYTIYDAATEKEIIADLAKVNVKQVDDWNHDKLTYPIYGLWIGTAGGMSLEVAWSNGYWITMDGAVYTFDYDFEKLLDDYTWEDKRSFTSTTALPCARELLLSEEGWVTEMLTPAEEADAPENVSMVLTEQEGKLLTVELTNHGTEEWCYGTYFSVQALVDGVWYRVPTTPENWGFNDIAMILPPGETREESYNLTMYGQLPAGTYRLLVEGMTAEFEIE